MSFDATNLCLLTDIGTITLDAPLDLDITLDKREPQDLQYQGVAVSWDGVWITYNLENLI
jgi:hypothetical protein